MKNKIIGLMIIVLLMISASGFSLSESEVSMPNIPQVKIGNTIYNLKDSEARDITSSLEYHLLIDTDDNLIDSCNTGCRITDDGIYFNKAATPFPVAMLNTNVLQIDDVSSPNKTQYYFIIAESSTAWVLFNMSGNSYYWKKDNSSYTGLESFSGFSFPTTVTFDDNSIILPDGKTYSIATVNEWLTSKSISDTVAFKLGVGCSENHVGITLPYRVPLLMNELHKEDLRYASIKKQPFGILDSNTERIQESENGLIFTNTSNHFWMTISNRIAYLGSSIHTMNNTWPVIAECENGVIIMSLGGRSIYYFSKDGSTLTPLDNGYSVTLPTYFVIRNAETIYFGGYEITKTFISSLLTSNGVSDTLTSLRLGMACNKAESGQLIPYVFASPTLAKGLNPWMNKTGDFLGDSLTAGGRYTGAFSSLYGIIVNNYGVSGTTISNIRASDMFYTRISSMNTNCDFVFFMGGTNDWGLGAPLGSASAIVSDDYSTFYSALYNTLDLLRQRFPTKPIFVSTITPRNWQSGGQASGIWDNGNGVSIMQFNDAIKFVANIFGCNVIDGFATGINIINLSVYTDDNLHFNQAGGIRFATYCMDMMKQITPY